MPMLKTTRASLGLLLGLIAIVAVSRLLPHPPNFTPVIALALFCGAALPSRWAGVAVLGAVMLLTDFLLGFHASLLAVYLSLALIVLLGGRLTTHSRSVAVLGHGLLAATLFFLLTNFAVWASSGVAAEPMYPPTLDGLISCYVMAIPFFGNTLLSTALFSALLFGLGRRWQPAAPAQAASGAA